MSDIAHTGFRAEVFDDAANAAQVQQAMQAQHFTFLTLAFFSIVFGGLTSVLVMAHYISSGFY